MNCRYIAACASTFVCAASISIAGQGLRIDKIDPSKYAPDELIVKFKPAAKDSDKTILHQRVSANLKRSHKALRMQTVKLPAGTDLQKAIDLYSGSPAVEYVEPNYVVSAIATTPNDPSFGSLWGMARLRATEAWDFSTGNTNLVVAVIDTGVYRSHEDLAANIWSNPVEVVNGKDDDGNGYIDDVYGWDFVNNDNDPSDDHGHGTHCAGTIAGVGNNGLGVAGVNWRLKVVGLKFLNSSGNGYTDGAISALEYCKAMGIKISNNSYGSSESSQAFRDAIAAYPEHMFVAAAGNSAANNDVSPNYPSSYDLDNIIAVAAINSSGSLAYFSSYGRTSVDIAAPGVDITSTFKDGPSSYKTWSGTSMATPHVAGAVALLWGLDRNRPGSDVKDAILSGCRSNSALANLVLTSGDLDLAGAFAAFTNTASRTRIQYFPMDTSPGWTMDTGWAFGQPTGGGGAYGNPDPTAGHTGTNVYGYNLDGDYTNRTSGTRWLTAGPFNLGSVSGTMLGFWRWLGVEQPRYDRVYVEVSSNGTSWVCVWSNQVEITDSAWVYQSCDISSIADRRSTVYIRWGLGPTDSSWTYCGWNIDDVEIQGIPIAPAVPAAPTGLTATAISSTNIALSWTDNSNDEDGFAIERKTGLGGSWGEIARISSNLTAYTNSALTPSTRYAYRLRAFNTNGYSSYSGEAEATTPISPDAWDPGDNGGAGATDLGFPPVVETAHGGHTLSAADTADWYKVRLTNSITYNFNSRGGSGDLFAELFSDSAGTTRVALDDDSGGDLQFDLNYSPPVTGDYYLRVKSYSTGADSSYYLRYSRRAYIRGAVSYAGSQGGTIMVAAASSNDGNRVLVLDGSGDYIQVGSRSSLVVSNEVTLEAWVNPDGRFSSAGYGTVVSKEGEYLLAIWSDLTIRWCIANTHPGWTWIDTGTSIPSNQWTHVAMTYDGSSVKTFTNACLVHSWSLPGAIYITSMGNIGDVYPSWNDFRIGWRQAADESYFRGLLDDIRVWNRSLAQAEIAENMSRRLSEAKERLVGYWTFDDGSAQDSTANTNHGWFIADATTYATNISGYYIFTALIAAPGAYSIGNVMTGMQYWATAFRDSNGNGLQNAWEPCGSWAGNPSAALTGDLASVDITMTDPPAPVIALGTNALSATLPLWRTSYTQSFDVWNSGNITLSYTVVDSATWLSVSPSSGTSTGEHDAVSVVYNATGLSTGTYSATVTVVCASASNSPQSVAVQLTVDPAPTVAFTVPTASSTYSTTNPVLSIGGTASDNGGVTQVTFSNNRSESGTCSGTTNWSCTNISLYCGINVITVVAYDATGNVTTNILTVTYSQETRIYEALLRAAMVATNINMSDNLVPGTTNTVQWSILSYVPLNSIMTVRLTNGVTTNDVMIQARRTGVEDGRWSIKGQRSKVYSFESSWIVPDWPGDCRIWFSAAQQDNFKYMIISIPGGIGGRAYGTDGKQIARTILGGGGFPVPTSYVPTQNLPLFDSIDLAILRAGATLPALNIPTNTFVPGQSVTSSWDVLSYVPIESYLVLRPATESEYNFLGTLTGSVDGSYSIGGRKPKVYSFGRVWTVPNDTGSCRLRIANTKSDGLAMTANMPGGVDPLPYGTDGKEIAREIGSSGEVPVVLAFGVTNTAGNIQYAGDAKWYSFTTLAADTYTAETALSGVLTDTTLKLFGPNNQTNLLASNDNYTNTTYASKVSTNLAAGLYYLKVMGPATGTGTYSVVVRQGP
jgi:subtilisin family serine protease